MNILLKGYLDRNFGDDIMLRIVAHQLGHHTFYICERKKELLLPFKDVPNVKDADNYPNIQFDACLRVTGSGFLIRSKMGILDTIFRLIRMKRSHKNSSNPGLAVINCNIGPFVNGFAEWVTKLELKRYEYISTRDQFSKRKLNNMFPTKSFRAYPDIVFSIPDEWLPPLTGENCLGISVYRQLFESNLECYKALAQIADQYIETTQNKVLLFAFDMESENDLASAFTIETLCKHKESIEIIAHNDDGDHIIRHFARCGKILGVRCHSSILAMRMGIPFVPIIYSNKTEHIFDDIGYNFNRFYWNQLDVKELVQAIDGATPFYVDKNIFELAKNHTRYFEEYIGSKGVHSKSNRK
jgi:Uncharacterized conserved protein